jgi:hypothetical protein
MTAQEYTELVEAKKRSLAITDERIARAPNTGERRTAEKRALLERTRQRALMAGLEPYVANH